VSVFVVLVELDGLGELAELDEFAMLGELGAGLSELLVLLKRRLG